MAEVGLGWWGALRRVDVPVRIGLASYVRDSERYRMGKVSSSRRWIWGGRWQWWCASGNEEWSVGRWLPGQ